MDEPARDGQRGREELLAKLSLEDKISLLTGADYWSLRRHSGIGLPATWPQSPDGLPATMPDGGVLAYTEGLHIGYRHFDRPGPAAHSSARRSSCRRITRSHATGPPIQELVQAVGLLARDSGDEFEVLIDVKDGQSGGFGCRGNEQVRD